MSPALLRLTKVVAVHQWRVAGLLLLQWTHMLPASLIRVHSFDHIGQRIAAHESSATA
jgi:hypothetical protein